MRTTTIMTPISYPILLRTCAIFFLFFSSTVSLQAQTRIIQGTVHHAGSNRPVSHATVRLGQRQAMTDQQGRFQFSEVQQEATEIHISAIGFQNKTLRIGTEQKPDDLQIKLQPSDAEIEQVDIIGHTENGDVYAFSPAVASADGTPENINTTKPSAVTRINAGTEEFDQDYFFNFEEKSGGLNITDWTYLGNNKFIVFSNEKSDKSLYGTGTIVGIIDVVDQTFQKVSGLPENVKSFTGRNNYALNDGNTGYIGVNLDSGIGYIYKINAQNATATEGLRVEGGTITAIQHFE